jgi:putative heme transporter
MSPSRPALRDQLRSTLGVLLPFALAVALLVVVLPAAVGAGWSEIGGSLHAISVPEVLVLTVVWWTGLSLQTIVQRTALPGLRYWQALQLNLSGSAVANVAPAGGALAMGLNFAMLRSWGIPAAGFGRYTVLTVLVATLVKLAMLPLAVVGMLLLGPPIPAGVLVGGVVAALLFAGILAFLRSDRAADATATGTDRLLERLAPLTRGRRWPGAAERLAEVHERTAHQLRAGSRRFTTGAGLYALTQVILLWLCLGAVGDPLPVTVVLAGYAVERAITAFPVTPGGSGLAETAAAATLVALGGGPATVAAAVLVYRGYVTLLEIPLGGLVSGIWLARIGLRRRSRSADGAELPDES